MNYQTKTKEQLIKKLRQMRQRILDLESTEFECRQAMSEIHRSYQIQAVLNRLLQISLKNITLDAMLEQFIDEVTSLAWLALESKGAIFLVGDEPGVLRMRTQRALSPQLVKVCARVPFGKCICGRAALLGETQFADGIDDRHEYAYIDIVPHGHYCVPIISGSGVILGVITLYVKEGHTRDHQEEDFLASVANTLAGIVELHKTQRKLRKRGQELEKKSRDLEELNTALRVLLKKRDEDKIELEENFLLNIRELIQPYLEKLKKSGLDERQRSYLRIIESSIHDLVSPFVRRLSSKYLNFSASEIQVANLVMDGKRTKEIALLLNVSDKTIEVHRKNIRKKLGLRGKKENLRTHLLALQ